MKTFIAIIFASCFLFFSHASFADEGSSLKQDAKSFFKKVGKKTKETAEKVADKTEEVAEKVVDKTKEKAPKAKKKVKSWWQRWFGD